MITYLFRNYRFFPEIILVILIIAVLAMMAVHSFLPYIAKARVLSVVGTFDVVKRDSMVYHAMHGEWPQNADQAIQSGMEEDYDYFSNGYQSMLENGAVSFTFDARDRNIAGKTITLRPAVPSSDPFGPVHWVCGDKKGETGWTIHGVDRTDVENRFIPWSFQ